MKLCNIRVVLNRGNCSNFQIGKRNIDIAVLSEMVAFKDPLTLDIGYQVWDLHLW